MTQATVNVGNSAGNSLNPNAQLFSSSEFNHGTVLPGSTAPSDDTYAEYLDNSSGTYHAQHPSHIYQVDPSSIDTSAPQQQNESHFNAHEHVPMLDTIEHQQSPSSSSTTSALLNTTHHQHHRHHPQTHIRQTMPDDEQVHQLTPEQLRQSLRKQLEYYFSRENMVHDRYLKSKMDAEDYVSIATIADFNLVKRMTHDLQLITDVLKELPSVEVDSEGKKVRSTEDKNYPIRKRCIIILRDVPLDATENEISDLFVNERCPVSAVAYEKALESGTSGCWYITFNSEDDAQSAFLYLTRENVSIRGQKVLARMKTRLWQKPSSVPSTHPTTPVSPPITNNNGGATSPPPPPSAQQPMLTYPNSTFVSQHQQQQQPQQGPPQYSSHSQQFNQQQIPPQQPPQPHGAYYMQTTGNTHPNQTSIITNLQGSTASYRHPIQSTIPPPTQHVSAQFSSTNPAQHPTSMEHGPVLQSHIRMNYPNYGANSPFDRTGWQTAHPQGVQTTQPTLSFATTPQATNMASYPTSMHQPGPFIAANNHFLHNVWYMPSAYQPNESYSTMGYNGVNKPKNRIPRDNITSSKPRNSGKPPGPRNSRHEGLPISNEHPNELLDYGQHSTPHSEGSSSPVPRAEVVLNRPIEPIVQQSLQHVQTYPSNTNETLTSDNVDHYHHPQSNNEILYNPNTSNSHPQQQTSSDTNSSQEQSNVNQSFDNSKLTYQPLEQRKTPSMNQDSQVHSTINENQPQSNNKKANSQPTSIHPLMPRENRSQQNSNRPNSSSNQQRRSQQTQQQHRMNSSSSAPLSVAIPKVSSATYYNQTSTSSPQSPTSNQKNQQLVNDNNGPRTYADMLKQKQAPQQQQQQQNECTKSPPNESNDLSSSRAQSPSVNNAKTDSNLVNADVSGPVSSSSSDPSPANRIEPTNPPPSSTNTDANSARRNSSASDHPQQQQQQQQQQQHSSSPSHQQYNNSRGRGRGGNYRYSNNERRSGSNNSLNRGGGGGGGGGRGGNRRSMNNNNNTSGSNGPSGYQSRGRGNGRFFDRSRGGGGNYHNSNQTVHRFTGNPGNVEPQAHFAE